MNELCGAKGRGLFGAEMFVKGDKVWFSELSPRPHDTGMVTMVSQNMSEMELHVRAILGLPIPEITWPTRRLGPRAGNGTIEDPTYTGIASAHRARDVGPHLRQARG